MTYRYKKTWEDYFEGGVAMWSYFGYKYHSYLITKHIIANLDIPKEGKIIQMGSGLGTTVELLCNLFGYDRVIGYDLFNPLRHPNIKHLDTEIDIPSDTKIAYVEIDVGSVNADRIHRLKLLEWALKNVVRAGYILTNKTLLDDIDDSVEVIHLNSFDIPELWENVHESRLNTKILLRKINLIDLKYEKYNSIF